jgi:hypothetical protein
MFLLSSLGYLVHIQLKTPLWFVGTLLFFLFFVFVFFSFYVIRLLSYVLPCCIPRFLDYLSPDTIITNISTSILYPYVD